MRRIAARCAALAACALPAVAAPDNPHAPDVAEPGSVEAIAEATSDAKFLNPWVSYVPESPSVPSPSDFLGHIAGAPGELSRTADVYGYFRALAQASPRVSVETIGETEEGRDIILAAIGAEDVVSDLPRYREATAQLADPRRCDESCLEAALEWARPIYYLNGGLHSTESGSPGMLMELAYRLAVSEQPLIRAIRERVIVLINPISEPDGRDRAVDWYYRFLKGKTDYDDLPEVSPPFWGRYVFHDNNRDSYQRALALTRALQDAFFRWHPQVVHDLHESIPFLLIWTGTGPYNVNMDPILVGEWHQMAFNEVRTLSSLGMPGVWTWGFGEGWGHMFVDSVAVNHNAIGRGYETFGIGSADTMDVRLDQPYRGFAVDLLQAQQYPADEVLHKPYDDVSWALPYHFGVDVLRVDDPGVREVVVEPVAAAVAYPGRVAGKGPVFLLRDSGQEALHAARHRLVKYDVQVAERAFTHEGREYPAGSWVLSGGRGLASALEAVADELGLDFDSAPARPGVPLHALDLPRLAVLHTWNDTQGAGWVRLLFDRSGIRYELINDDDVKQGKLERRFDVILYPHTYDSLQRVIQGIDPKHGPMPYTRTKDFPSHGTPDASPDITGGLTLRGLANLQRFVERGGVLVTLGGASRVPIEGGFVRGVRRAATEELHTPGVEIRARFVRPEHPLAYGYPEVISVFWQDLPLYETREADFGRVVLQWGLEPMRYDDEASQDDGPWGAGEPDAAADAEAESESGKRNEADTDLVVSGGMTGESEFEGRPAILDIPVGRGRVVAFGFDPIHRTLVRSDFRLLWNALLNWNDLPDAPANPPEVVSR